MMHRPVLLLFPESAPLNSLPPLLSTAISSSTSSSSPSSFADPPLHLIVYLSPPASALATRQSLAQLIASTYVHLTAAAVQSNRFDWRHDVFLAGYSIPLRQLLADVAIADEDIWTIDCSLAAAAACHRVPHQDVAEPFPAPFYPSPSYATVAVGGTFDHLHPGHKLLLSCTALVGMGTIIVGIVDDRLLVNKMYANKVEPYSVRESQVRRFLNAFAPGRQVVVQPLMDAFGPAATVANLDVLVATVETEANSRKVNDERAKNGLGPIAIELIRVISSTSAEEVDITSKLSSTAIRAWFHERDANGKSGV